MMHQILTCLALIGLLLLVHPTQARQLLRVLDVPSKCSISTIDCNTSRPGTVCCPYSPGQTVAELCSSDGTSCLTTSSSQQSPTPAPAQNSVQESNSVSVSTVVGVILAAAGFVIMCQLIRARSMTRSPRRRVVVMSVKLSDFTSSPGVQIVHEQPSDATSNTTRSSSPHSHGRGSTRSSTRGSTRTADPYSRPPSPVIWMGDLAAAASVVHMENLPEIDLEAHRERQAAEQASLEQSTPVHDYNHDRDQGQDHQHVEVQDQQDVEANIPDKEPFPTLPPSAVLQ